MFIINIVNELDMSMRVMGNDNNKRGANPVQLKAAWY